MVKWKSRAGEEDKACIGSIRVGATAAITEGKKIRRTKQTKTAG
jgi:hypothetical protein